MPTARAPGKAVVASLRSSTQQTQTADQTHALRSAPPWAARYQMASPAENLQDRIDDQLDAFDSLEELSDARYHETHERFEAASNQRALILDWLEDFAERNEFPAHRRTRMLSVGCGGGVMDRRITQVFAEHVSGLSLVGVDPNAEHTQAFQKQFAADGFETEACTALFENFESDAAFDIIHFVHCLYYFEHIEPELRKAFDMLGLGGALIVLQAPNKALNHLADRVWKKQFDQSAWYSDDVAAALERLNIGFKVHRIDADIDVTECFRPDSSTGVDILDFIVQADTRQFSHTLQASLLESLRSICRRQGRRLLCSHPVDAIVARRQG
jgi:histamine N-methyltransferase